MLFTRLRTGLLHGLLVAACCIGGAAAQPASTAPTAAPAAPTAASGATGAGPAAAPGIPRPFREVVRDTKEQPGLFTLYSKDERVWLAIRPEQFDKRYFFSVNIPQSVGERGLYGSQMGRSALVSLRRMGSQVQLIAHNTEFYAQPGTPQAQMVSQSFSDSLLASAPVVSLPHGDSKAVLIDASALLFADIPGYLTRLETAFRIPFALDTRNTSFTRLHNSAGLTGLRVQAHFSVPRLPAPPAAPAGATPGPPSTAPTPPAATPDARSLFVSFYYNFSELPATPMRTRVADERIGHFVSSRTDYSDDRPQTLRKHILKRWRLEKSDPAATLSDPKQPIVYWLDKSIPLKYRAAVSEGVLEWNKAFERIGFRNAIVVKQQGDNDDFDTMDARHASIRWFTGADVGFAIGPSHMDPRTGEILDADIATGDGFTRLGRRLAREEGRASDWRSQAHAAMAQLTRGDMAAEHESICDHAAHTAHDFHYALELLDARGVEPDSPQAEALAFASIRRNVMHEVGHTLGLRHNFRASSIYSLKQLEDPEFTRRNGMAGSIMEYLAFNVAPAGTTQGDMINTTIGPYDYWAIEYAYRELDPATEADELARIASRSSEPELAFASDGDAGGIGAIDPAVNTFDLGSDPLAFYRRRMQLNRELWDRAQKRQLQPGESYERQTRSLQYGFSEMARVAPMATKYIGGVTHLRDRAGSGRAVFEPVAAERQREALALLSKDLFDSSSLRFAPEFLSRLAVDHFERSTYPDFSVSATVLSIQSSVLDALLSDSVAARLLNSVDKVADPSRLFRLPELYDTLQGSIWSELKAGGDIRMMRRNLQREHLKRLVAALLRPSPRAPADVASLQRQNAVQLLAQLRTALARPSPALSREARAHLADAQHTLDEALKAPMQRTAP